MKIINRTIALILCLATLLSVCSCMSTQTGNEGSSSTPNINISVIEGDTPNKDLENAAHKNSDISEMVYLAVQSELMCAGFNVSSGIAFSEKPNGYTGLGLYYYSEEFNIFAENTVKACGFVEILPQGINPEGDIYNADETIYVCDVSEEDNQKATANIEYLIYSYDYENICPNHFIYKGKYITYYREKESLVRYTIQDNIKENYDLSLGNIYDYDNDIYVYDSSIFGEYRNHSAVELFGEINYNELELELKNLSSAQLANGYVVNEFNIVYISPEAIQTYLLSDEEDTFFGYSVDELSLAFGAGTALTYTKNGFSEAQILPDNDYNWKSFLIKCGVGCGIILVGAILTPVTGGASFGCALITITKFAVGSAIAEGLGTLAIETVVGLIQGQTIEEAIKSASYKGLDAFANGFMIGAAIGSVGVVSGLIKPSACFVAGTAIAIGNGVYKDIEDISTGDYVLSYNEYDQSLSLQQVTETFKRKVFQTLKMQIGSSWIETTTNHPFYSPTLNIWVEAEALNVGDLVLDSNGKIQIVKSTKNILHDDGVYVYNFSVNKNHTYYVSEEEILVHNKCATEIRLEQKSAKAQKDAVESEIMAIRRGNSKNTYPKEFIKKISDPSISDAQAIKTYAKEFRAHHIIPIDKINKLNLDPSLVTNPKNLLVVRTSEHSVKGSTTAIHQLFGGVGRGSDLNMGIEYFQYLCKLKPGYAKNIIAMGKLAGVM